MNDLERKQANNKILIIGVDGMDPRATEHYLSMGKMPNVKKLLERGAANEHLEMIGGHPTGTPPMWTTLATGCYANVHGITCFNLQSDKGPEYNGYAFDSRKCRAEQLWNVFAEEGMKTLVFHWPGSSWPPSSDSQNLHVVDGTQPSGVNLGVGTVSMDFFAVADKDIQELTFKAKGAVAGVAPCESNDDDKKEEEVKKEKDVVDGEALVKPDFKAVLLNAEEGTDGYVKNAKYDRSESPIKPAHGWVNAPEDALEFTILMSGGLLRRPSLILKNENGIYDKVAIYASKKAEEPMAVIKVGEMKHDFIDVDYRNDVKHETNKSIALAELAEDGSKLRMYVSKSIDIHTNMLFHPLRLYDEVVKNVGYPGPTCMLVPDKGNGNDLFTCMIPIWDRYCRWQSDALQYLIDHENYDVVFSHNHNIDGQMHAIARNLKERDYSRYSAETAKAAMERVYEQTDEYVGSFLHYLDEGWTIFLVSDHALICPEYERPEFGDVNGVNVGLMRDLGFTVMVKDENGNETHDIDWTKTTAVASRANNIYINLKGRYDHGIVDPEDKYELEEEIMTALYNVKHPVSGKRIIGLALRNKDAIIMGYGGDQCGDIVAWTAEGYNDDHFDAITTAYGINYTSLMPILIAAGPGIKENVLTKRVIRQVDFAPTVAIIGGVRMPRECEGAPIYQILEKEY